MAAEGQVIACHTMEEWTQNLENNSDPTRLVVIDFFATWCPPCRMIAPYVAELAKKLPQVTFLKVDVDELPNVARYMSVESMPTFILKKGIQVVDKVVGSDKGMLEEAIGKHMGPVCAYNPIERMAVEGQVVACHTVEEWTENLQSISDPTKLVVVDFFATWCPPCRAIAPFITELAKKLPEITFLKVDVDELPFLAREMSVKSMPTFILMKGGNVVDTVVGANKDNLQDTIAMHMGSSCTYH